MNTVISPKTGTLTLATKAEGPKRLGVVYRFSTMVTQYEITKYYTSKQACEDAKARVTRDPNWSIVREFVNKR